MKLIVGLGNPGEKYKHTRHNLGFLALDHFAAQIGAQINQKKKKTLYCKIRFQEQDLVLLKPQTFMNLSGEAVLYLASFLKIPPQEIIVLCDDTNLEFSSLRIRRSGSDGGHNGLKSLISSLNSDQFVRIRMGVGQPVSDSVELKDYVLHKFRPDEWREVPSILERASEALSTILSDSLEQAMNAYNRTPERSR